MICQHLTEYIRFLSAPPNQTFFYHTSCAYINGTH